MNDSLINIFDKQKANQIEIFKKGKYKDFVSFLPENLPIDEVRLASYHIQQLMSEIGEVLDADKRWKNFRNEKYDKEAKLEEIADCFIVLMNIAMFSDIDAKELSEAINKKIEEVHNRIVSIE